MRVGGTAAMHLKNKRNGGLGLSGWLRSTAFWRFLTRHALTRVL